MGRSRYKIFVDDPNHPYFLTCTVVNWLLFFNNPVHVSILRIKRNFCKRKSVKSLRYTHCKLNRSAAEPSKYTQPVLNV